jgi:hypothetical protein
VKLCPGCGERKERDQFYDEPNDPVTGLSMLCVVCLGERKKKRRKRKRNISGWHVTSPSGLHGDVINVREETSEIAIRFRSSRTVVLPMLDSTE